MGFYEVKGSATITEIVAPFSSPPSIARCCANVTFPWLAARAAKNEIQLNLGRAENAIEPTLIVPPNTRITVQKGHKRFLRPQPFVAGRVVLDSNRPYPFHELGLAELVERSRFSFLPMEIASRWGSNRIIDSRNCFELMDRNYLIPRNYGFYEPSCARCSFANKIA
jgi:hypothetical protein